MGPAVMPGQDLAETAGPVRDGAAADLAARDRKTGNALSRGNGGNWTARCSYTRPCPRQESASFPESTDEANDRYRAAGYCMGT